MCTVFTVKLAHVSGYLMDGVRGIGDRREPQSDARPQSKKSRGTRPRTQDPEPRTLDPGPRTQNPGPYTHDPLPKTVVPGQWALLLEINIHLTSPHSVLYEITYHNLDSPFLATQSSLRNKVCLCYTSHIPLHRTRTSITSSA